MPRDAGTQSMQTALLRRRAALIALIVVALGLMAYRLVPKQTNAHADDVEPSALEGATAKNGNPFAGLTPVDVTWPVALERDLFRSASTPTTLGPAREELIRTEALGTIRPQMILQGRPARVMIDGRVLEVGDVISSFTLRRIESRAIVVEKGGVQVRIEI
jgi:hypothetical protein